MASRNSQVPRNKGRKLKGLPTPVRKLLVKNAKEQKDVLSLVRHTPLTHALTHGARCSVAHVAARGAGEDVRGWVCRLTADNVRQLYIDAGWGWSEEQKEEELTCASAQYLLVRDEGGSLVAFTHFRFDMDYGRHVLYCYELQVSREQQGSGLGAWLMSLLYEVASRSRMERVVLTVGRNNPRAVKFYLELGYAVDETSAASLADTKSGSYLILSRACKPMADGPQRTADKENHS